MINLDSGFRRTDENGLPVAFGEVIIMGMLSFFSNEKDVLKKEITPFSLLFPLPWPVPCFSSL
jgi:hypothetical protein